MWIKTTEENKIGERKNREWIGQNEKSVIDNRNRGQNKKVNRLAMPTVYKVGNT